MSCIRPSLLLSLPKVLAIRLYGTCDGAEADAPVPKGYTVDNGPGSRVEETYPFRGSKTAFE
jgi:hypothetical protein